MEKLSRLEIFKNATIILAFLPLADEVDLRCLFDNRFLFPFTDGNDMFFSRPPLKKGRFGVYEPVRRIIEKYEKAVMLVPGLAFTKEGYRLGRGGGFYDRYIQKNKERLYTIGLSYNVNLVEKIPLESFDQKLDLILTP